VLKRADDPAAYELCREHCFNAAEKNGTQALSSEWESKKKEAASDLSF